MTFWYDFGLFCDLRPNTPQDVVDLLKYIVGLEEEGYSPPPKDSLPFVFESYRRTFKHGRDASESLFPGAFGASLRRMYRHLPEGDSGDRYTFSFRCVMQDDEFADQFPIVSWLAPYTETGGMGFFYTTFIDIPAKGPYFIHFLNGKAEFYDVHLEHIGTGDQSETQWIDRNER